MNTHPTVEIEVWSDYVCPFCYLAEPTLAQVEQEFKTAVRINWRAFELRPEPVPTLDPKGDYLRDVWARAVYPMAKARGMVLHLPPVQPRSRLAHEVAAFAREKGRFNETNDALFRAFFEHGKDIGKTEVLAKIAIDAGLNSDELLEALAQGRCREQVLKDEALAQELGLSGVPASRVRTAGEPLEKPVLIDGAQPFEVFQQVLTRVLETENRK
jgi:predicted DsbA family dithiol-disulfide isomerase